MVDEGDIPARVVKHSQPVKHLDPHDNHDERAEHSFVDILQHCNVKQRSDDQSEIHRVLEQVKQVHAGDEIFVALLPQLVDFSMEKIDD